MIKTLAIEMYKVRRRKVWFGCCCNDRRAVCLGLVVIYVMDAEDLKQAG